MIRLFAAAAIALQAGLAAAQQPPQLTFEATELRGGVVMLSSGIAGNLAVLTGSDGLLLVDDQLPGTGPQVEAALDRYAGEGVPRFILNTHWHGDHAGSNAHFHAHGATVAAHHNVRARIAGADPERAPWTAEDGAAPILTFGADLHFHMNGQTIRAVHVPDAHTDGDVLVYFEEADILHMGDVMFAGRYPFIDLSSGGTVEGYIAAMRAGYDIAGPDTQIIPGHGPLATRDDLLAAIDMLGEAQARIGALAGEGLSLEAVTAAAPLADFDADWSWRFICTDRMVAILYADATGGEPPGLQTVACPAP